MTSRKKEITCLHVVRVSAIPRNCGIYAGLLFHPALKVKAPKLELFDLLTVVHILTSIIIIISQQDTVSRREHNRSGERCCG